MICMHFPLFFSTVLVSKHHSTYSSQNCNHECQGMRLRATCKCAMYFQLQLDNNSDICGNPQFECVHLVVTAFAMKANDTYRCDCLPSCHDNSYSTSMSMSPIVAGSDITRTTGMNHSELVVLSAFFEKSYYRAYKRDPSISFTGFLCK